MTAPAKPEKEQECSCQFPPLTINAQRVVIQYICGTPPKEECPDSDKKD